VTLDDTNRQRIEKIIGSDRVVLFMKGDRNVPQCGFSATVVQILDSLVPEYTTVDVLGDPRIREGIKEFSSWPTVPQLYVGGEFLGGCDIVREMYSSGELQQMLAQAGEPAPR
jgi:monothiol glutaredoxin